MEDQSANAAPVLQRDFGSAALNPPPDLSCPVCHTLFIDPLRTPCEHVFCSSCVSALTQYAKDQRTDWFFCPLCRNKIGFDQHSPNPLSIFPVVEHISSQVDSFKERYAGLADSASKEYAPNQGSGVSEPKCSVDECSNTPAFFCAEGCGDLCVACSAIHARFPASKGHKVVSTVEKDTILAQPVCQIHGNEKIQFSCKTCIGGKFMCLTCAYEHFRRHPTHVEVPWDQMVGTLESELKATNQEMGEVLDTTNSRIALYESEIHKGIDELDEVKDQIREKFQEYKDQINEISQKIDQLETSLLSKADEMHTKIWKEIEMEYQHLQSSKLANESSIRFTDYVLSTYKAYKCPQKYCEAKSMAISIRESHKSEEVTKQLQSVTDRIGGRLEFFSFEGDAVTFNIPMTFSWLKNVGNATVWRRNPKSNPREYRYQKKAGSSGQGQVQFGKPWAIAVHPKTGDIYVGEQDNHRVQVLTDELEFVKVFGSKGSNIGQMNSPLGIAISQDGLVAVSENNGNRVQIFNEQNEVIATIQSGQKKSSRCTMPSEYDGLSDIHGLVFDTEGNLYVTNKGRNRIDKFNRFFEFEFSFAQPSHSENGIKNPEGICFTSKNEICVVGHGGDKLRFYDTNGKHVRNMSIQKLGGHASIAEGPNNTIFLSDRDTHRIVVYNESGDVIHTLGSGSGSADGQFYGQKGLCFGMNEKLYICDWNNHRIQVFSNQT